MIRVGKLMAEGRDAFVAHRFKDEPLRNPYNRGTKGYYYWTRGVEVARAKVTELMEIGQ